MAHYSLKTLILVLIGNADGTMIFPTDWFEQGVQNRRPAKRAHAPKSWLTNF
jgi:hypothetical protein